MVQHKNSELCAAKLACAAAGAGTECNDLEWLAELFIDNCLLAQGPPGDCNPWRAVASCESAVPPSPTPPPSLRRPAQTGVFAYFLETEGFTWT